jgi:hypothetical protein
VWSVRTVVSWHPDGSCLTSGRSRPASGGRLRLIVRTRATSLLIFEAARIRMALIYRPTDQASSVRTSCIFVRTFTVSRSYCSSLHPSGRFSSPSGRFSVIDQLWILSKFKIREDCFNRPDEVDSRPNALIHKARIAIQISPSGRQSALVRMRVQQLRKLPIRLQPSGRLPIMVRTRA